MLPNPEKKDGRASSNSPAARPALNLVDAPPSGQSVFSSQGAPAFPAVTRIDVRDVAGTVGAASPLAEEQAYGSGSRAFLGDGPLVPSGGRLAISPGLRASLITELREISGQVNRMMAQVDRAINRLGEHAGEPLRR